MDRGVDHLRRDGEELGVPPGPAALHAPDRRDDQRPRGRPGQLRRHHLRQGRLGAQAARRVGRHRRVLRRRRRLLQEARAGATPSSRDLLAELEATSGRDLTEWSKLWLETAGVNTLRPEIDDRRRRRDHLASRSLQTAPRRLPDDPPAPPRRSASTTSRAARSCAPTASSSTSTATRTEVPELVGLRPPRPRAAQRRRPRLRQDPPRRARRSPSRSSTSRASTTRCARSLVWGSVVGRHARRRDPRRATSSRLVLGNIAHRDRVDDAPHRRSASWRSPPTQYVAPEHRVEALARRSATRCGRSRRRAEAGSDAQFQFVKVLRRRRRRRRRSSTPSAALRDGEVDPRRASRSTPTCAGSCSRASC